MRLSSRLHRRFGLRKVYALGCVVYAIGFLLWGLVESRTIVSLLAVFEGAGFSLLFTTSILVVGKLLPSSLYSTGNSIGAMVGFGISPIIGAGLGGRGVRTARVHDALRGLLGHRAARRRRRDDRAAHPVAGSAARGVAPARGRCAGARTVVTPAGGLDLRALQRGASPWHDGCFGPHREVAPDARQQERQHERIRGQPARSPASSTRPRRSAAPSPRRPVPRWRRPRRSAARSPRRPVPRW